MNPLQEIDPTAVLPSVDDLIPSTLTDDATTEPAPALPHFFSQIISSIFDGGVNPSAALLRLRLYSLELQRLTLQPRLIVRSGASSSACTLPSSA
jgi:hypothetical protein